jgi:hypothetical protein
MARLLGLGVCLFVMGCGGSNQAEPCPTVPVVLDAAVESLPPIGEFGDEATCAQFCDKDHPVCRRIKEMELTCQAGCN